MARGKLKLAAYRLDEAVVKELRKRSALEGRPAVLILEKALKNYFSNEKEETAIEGTFRLVSKIEGRTKGARADLEALTDLLCFFIYHWFCHTPALPTTSRTEAASTGMARYHRFIEMLRKRRSSGESLSKLYIESSSEIPPE